MPTLQDVASLAGVSTATVSKVLSNTPYVSEKTRAKVLQAVDELGYRPNLAARALSSGKTYIIGVVFPYVYDAIFKDPLVMNILEGIESISTERGYNLLLNTPRIDKDGIEHYAQMLSSGYLEGVIAIDNVPAISFAGQAQQLNVPAVILGHHEGRYTVRSDNYRGGYLSMERALRSGHRKIGIISAPSQYNLALDQRLQGMQDAAQAAQVTFADFPIYEGDFSSESGARAVVALLEQQPDTTMILSLNDRMAIGAMRRLQEMGRHIPDDISIIGYDNISIAGLTTPRLSTIDQRGVLLGQAAARLLFDVLENKDPQSMLLAPEYIQRGTTRAIQ